jgi:hypothetical protein
MGLQEKLNTMKEGSKAKLPVEVLGVMKRGLDHLAASGRKEQALKAGDAIPAFDLQDGEGQAFSSRDLVGQKPLVINFYRGLW